MNKIEFGDCREIMRRWAKGGAPKARCCVTSPPYYGLRDYGVKGQIGLEETPEAYVAEMVSVFRAVRDMLTDDGTLWLNIGDSYNGSGKGRGAGGVARTVSAVQSGNHGSVDGSLARSMAATCKPKDLIGIPWMLAFALRADGWYLRQDIIWHKPNVMPESVKDRCTRNHEYVFLLSKNHAYYFDTDAIAEKAVSRGDGKFSKEYAAQQPAHGGFSTYENNGRRNKRSVWVVANKPYKGAHSATYPVALIKPCILAGSARGDVVLDPFMGSGTTAQAALTYGRRYMGCELNGAAYGPLQERRIERGRKAVGFGLLG